MSPTKQKKPCGCDKSIPDVYVHDILLEFNGQRRGIKLGWAYKCDGVGCDAWTINPYPGKRLFIREDDEQN